jgi:hypothetical protein
MLEKNRDRLVANGELQLEKPKAIESEDDEEGTDMDSETRLPGFFSQFSTLLSRRWRIFFRDRGQVFLQLAILICFPILVILFAPSANQPMRKFTDSAGASFQQKLEEQAAVQADRLKVGSAVSGIIMFQVVLLSLMGSNNAAREIAAERQILEKEKFGGVSPIAYLMSKVIFLSGLVLIQSLWMAGFVELFWSFKGNFTQHALFLVLVNAAMTSVCLGISSLMGSAEKASLLSVYLVGFQLPLSGAVLALPDHIEPLTRPFISAYWAWSGSVDSLSGDYRSALTTISETQLSAFNSCFFVLIIHIFVGLAASMVGTSRPQWEH